MVAGEHGVFLVQCEAQVVADVPRGVQRLDGVPRAVDDIAVGECRLRINCSALSVHNTSKLRSGTTSTWIKVLGNRIISSAFGSEKRSVRCKRLRYTINGNWLTNYISFSNSRGQRRSVSL